MKSLIQNQKIKESILKIVNLTFDKINTVVFVIKRRWRRLTVTVAGPLVFNEKSRVSGPLRDLFIKNQRPRNELRSINIRQRRLIAKTTVF